jgi:hypothetical protein
MLPGCCEDAAIRSGQQCCPRRGWPRDGRIVVRKYTESSRYVTASRESPTTAAACPFSGTGSDTQQLGYVTVFSIQDQLSHVRTSDCTITRRRQRIPKLSSMIDALFNAWMASLTSPPQPQGSDASSERSILVAGWEPFLLQRHCTHFEHVKISNLNQG